MSAKLEKVVKPSWAANVVSVDYFDLPRLDRPWTEPEVWSRCDSKPDWLSVARRGQATQVQEAGGAWAVELDGALARLGYAAPGPAPSVRRCSTSMVA